VADDRLTRPARDAIRKVLADSERDHGEVGRRRYAALLEAALRDLSEDPFRPSARRDVVDDVTLQTYRLALAKHRVPDPPGRVRDPAHALVYEVVGDVVQVYGLIHERMHPTGRLRRLGTTVMRDRG